MIPFEEMDDRLATIKKSRAWLAEITMRSPDTVRTALAPNAPAAKRSSKLQKIFSDAIEGEENRAGSQAKIPPGYSDIFLTDEQLNRADTASRMIGAASLADFCREAILLRANEILLQGRGAAKQYQQAPQNIEHLPLAAEPLRKYPAKARKA